MEEITQIVNEFLNIPAVQVVVSIVTLCLAILRIIASTSVGKRALNQLKTKILGFEIVINEEQQKLIEAKKALEETNALLRIEQENHRKDIDELKNNYEMKIAYLDNKYTGEINIVLKALSHVNNVAIKNIIDNHKVVENTEIELSDLEDQIKEKYKNQFEELSARLEVLENGKETKNNQTIEE